MKFAYRLAGTGWAQATISCGDRSADLTASYLSDALGDLLRVIVDLTTGRKEGRCQWAEEPGTFRWLFVVGEDAVVDLRILWFDNEADTTGHEVFGCAVSLIQLSEAIADAADRVLEETDVDAYRTAWIEHDFPQVELRALKEYLRVQTPGHG